MAQSPQAAAAAAALVKIARGAIILGVTGSIAQTAMYTGEGEYD